MSHTVILVVCGTHREFLHYARKKIEDAATPNTEPSYVLSPNRLRINGTDYLYMDEPDSMRGLLADKIEYWGTWDRRSQRDLELFRIIGNSRIKRKEKA